MQHRFAVLDAKVRESNVFMGELLHECLTLDVAALQAESAPLKARVVESVNRLGPPPQFRLIDCHATLLRRRVVLVDGRLHLQRHAGYTIISHTWGEEVYGVFDCECACECYTSIPRCDSRRPCRGAHGTRHGEVVADILRMCERLVLKAGSEFVWHDGVCIAQHDKKELEETIRHMGWLYANATDTIIFMDYVGMPMPLLMPHEPYRTRWNTRVWTLQEAVLSRRRLYCIRMVTSFCVERPTFANLIAEVARSCEDDSCIGVIEEDTMWEYLVYLFYFISMTMFEDVEGFGANMERVVAWHSNLGFWINLMKDHCFRFPTLSTVLRECAGARNSKHKGDRINAVLALAGVTDYVAPKDGDLEASSIEFFKRLNGQDVILEAVFWVNCSEEEDSGKKHTWLPSLSTLIMSTASLKKVQHSMGHDQARLPDLSWYHTDSPGTRFFRSIVVAMSPGPTRGVVMENGMLRLQGHFWSVPVKFTFQEQGHNAELPPLKLDEEKQCFTKDGRLLLDVKETWLRSGGYESFARASSTKLGQATFPVWFQALGRPVVRGWPMEAGKTLEAHLVFPTDLMIQGEEECGGAALIVAGDPLHLPVWKLGRFSALPNLTSIICSKNQAPFTVLDQLVVF